MTIRKQIARSTSRSGEPGTPLSAPFLYPLIPDGFFDLLSLSCNVACLNDAFMVAAWSNRSRGTRVVIPDENPTTVLPRIKPFSLRSSRFAFTTRLSLGEGRARGEKICSRGTTWNVSNRGNRLLTDLPVNVRC